MKITRRNLKIIIESFLNESNESPEIMKKKRGKIDYWKKNLGKIFAGDINFHTLLDGPWPVSYRAGFDNRYVEWDSKQDAIDFFKNFKNEFMPDGVVPHLIVLNHMRELPKYHVEGATAAGWKVHLFHTGGGKGLYKGKRKSTLDMDSKTWKSLKNILKNNHSLIHCTHGADRTGATVARFYVDEGEGGFTVDDALKDAYEYKSGGESGFMRNMKFFIENGPPDDITQKSGGKNDTTIYEK